MKMFTGNGANKTAKVGLAFLLCSLSRVAFCQTHPSFDATTQTASSLLQQGTALAAKGQLAQAEIVLEQAHRSAPHDQEVLITLGKVKARMGETDAAVSLFRQAEADHPRVADLHVDLAVALADAHRLPEALSEATRAIELSPRLASAHLNRARILDDLHRVAEAETEFADAAKLAPANADCLYYWALLEREQSNYARESSLLQKLVELQPRDDQAWLLLGDSLSYQSRQAEAIASWREALRINPQSSQAAYKLSRALRASNPEEAKKLESDFAKLQSQAATLDQVKKLGNEAYLSMQAQNWPAAIPVLRQAISLCANCEVSGQLHKNLGLALCHNGQLRDGRQELQDALQLDPADPDIVKALHVIDQQPPQ